jgi:serine/threonine protein kinase
VLRATRKHDNHSVAIKELFHIIETLSADIWQGLKEEIKIMKAYPHPLICKLIDDFIDPAGH